MRYFCALLVFSLMAFGAREARAAHLIGGELNYRCINDSVYEITLVIYRDCAGSGADFDNPSYLFVYDAAGTYLRLLTLTSPSITLLPVTSDNPCLTIPPGICVERGIYTGTFTLPPIPGGYQIVYQRCCRNGTIDNLLSPGATGSSYVETIPPPSDAPCNSSPVFNNFPPIVLCAGEPLVFDHSATDLDGDSLVYSLCAPFSGASSFCPFPAGPFTTGGCPSTPGSPPYPPVSYAAGFSAGFPVSSSPPLSIDPVTGQLTGTPSTPGQYVVGVCVEEYRDGVLLNNHARDFQFNVASCEPLVSAAIPSFILNCEDRTVSWENFSTGASSWFWDFGVPGISGDTSDAFLPPPFTYPDTGTYTVTLIANPGFLCADTATATVGIYPTLIGGFSVVSGCSARPVVFTDTSLSTGAGTLDFWSWSFGDGAGSPAQNPTHLYGEGGTYSVQFIVGTDRGCRDTIVQVITVEPGPFTQFEVDPICQDEPAVFVNTSLLPTGIPVAWEWDFGNGEGSEAFSVEYFYPEPGTYTVTLIGSSPNGCNDTASAELLVGLVPVADAGSDATVEYLDAHVLQGSGGGSYLWSPSTYLSDSTAASPVFTAWLTTVFTLVVTSADGCADTSSVRVEVLPQTVLDVPNAFSPNGDGTNDVLSLLTNDIQRLDFFRIYNRWGELIFESNDLSQGWDGSYKGTQQETGGYLYAVQAIGAEGETVQRQGVVLLVR